MAIQRIKVLDYKALGNLFIDWALNSANRPKNKDEFVQKAVTPGWVDTLPDYIKTVTLVQSGIDDLLIRLPPADLVRDTQANIKAGLPYDFPQQAFYVDRLAARINDTDFFGFRVGDYTISNCS